MSVERVNGKARTRATAHRPLEAMEDADLLRAHAECGDEAAFAELVRRHVDMVYSAAVRQVGGDAHLARDVTQRVFVDLARKARALAETRVLAGWLFVSTRYAAAKVVRGERRRRRREEEAHIMDKLTRNDASERDWACVRPVLDEAMGELKAEDREAILLRFFEGRGFTEIGARLRMSENAARMRVGRALDKLHGLLARRGVTSTAGAVAAVLANQAVVAAPAGLAASVSGVALTAVGASGAAASVGFMTMGKLSVGVMMGVLVGATGGLWWERGETAELEREHEQMRRSSDAVVARADVRSHAGREAELAEANQQDAELNRLAGEAAALKLKMEVGRVGGNGGAQANVVGASGGAKSQRPEELDRLPRPTHRRPPKYPDDLRQLGMEGEAVIRIVVDADGRVAKAEVVRSTHPSFEAAALEAVKAWQFEAGRKGGRPVNAQLEMPIRFTLSKEAGAIGNWF